MFPIQINDKEQAALESLTGSIETALDEANVELEIPSEYTGVRGFYDHNIKMNKIAYAAIEEFDLPLVRTWYRYGQFEPYQQIRPKSITVGQHSQDAYVPSSRRTDVTQNDIKEFLLERDLSSIFEKDLFEFLIDNYNEWDPEPYTDTYVASTKIIKILEEMETSDTDAFLRQVGDLRNQFKQASLDLRYEIKRIDTFGEDVHQHIDYYLQNLEDALIKVDETSEVSDSQLEALKQSRVVYHEFVWPWAAINISLDKATGPVEEIKKFDKSGKEKIEEDKKSFNTHIKGWETDLEDEELKPGIYTRGRAVQRSPEAIAQLQRSTHKTDP